MQEASLKGPDQPSTVCLFFLFFLIASCYLLIAKAKGCKKFNSLYRVVWTNAPSSGANITKQPINLLIMCTWESNWLIFSPTLHHSQTINSLPFCPLYLPFARLSVPLLAASCWTSCTKEGWLALRGHMDLMSWVLFIPCLSLNTQSTHNSKGPSQQVCLFCFFCE